MPAFVSQANVSTPAAQPPPTLMLIKRLTASVSPAQIRGGWLRADADAPTVYAAHGGGGAGPRSPLQPAR